MQKITGYPEGYVGPILPGVDREAAAAGIGALMPYLDERHDGKSWDLSQLDFVAASPSHDEMIAVAEGRIVGAAALTLTVGPFEGFNVRLGDFVTHPDHRGRPNGQERSTAQKMWDAMIAWCQAKKATTLNFESEVWRPEAHRFYQRNGAIKDEDNVHFVVPISSVEGVAV